MGSELSVVSCQLSVGNHEIPEPHENKTLLIFFVYLVSFVVDIVLRLNFIIRAFRVIRGQFILNFLFRPNEFTIRVIPKNDPLLLEQFVERVVDLFCVHCGSQ